MATEIILKVDGNFLLVTDDSNGNVSNFPLSSTSYEIFTPKEVDDDSPDNKTYLFFTNLDGSKRKTGGWDIFCDNNNYYFSLYGVGNFATLQNLIDYLDDTLAGTSLPYKKFVALLTQSGISSPDSKSSGTLTKGVSYMFSGTGGTSVDFSNVGVNNPTDGGWFIATQTAEPINWDGWVVAYDSATPVANVLENNIGNVWFLFNSNGRYSLASDALFIDNKTVKFGGYVNSDLGSYFLFGDQNDNSGEIFLSTGDPTPSNGYLNNATIEVRVYN